MQRLWTVAALVAAGCSPPPVVDTATVTLNGGTFVMGSTTECSDNDGAACTGDRVPHKVRISPFTIDDTEVTQRQYADCVQHGLCDASGATYPLGDDSPVLVDDPALARKYCAARKTPMRLATEAEFEFASRVLADGTQTDFTWGSDAPPSCARLPLAGCVERNPRIVGTTPGDVSPSGVHDLAGNVPEWVEDSYNPYIGCADHLSYGELCWGRSHGCAGNRCITDGQFCIRACLPTVATTNPTGGGDPSTPVCSVPPDAALVIDPVSHGSSPFAVIRGGGPNDGGCAFAAWNRRHAAPKSFVAGFRCAISGDKLPRKAAPTYRFAINGCTPSGRVRISIKLASGTPAGYSVDYFPPGATAPLSVTATTGIVDDLPCDSIFVVYPQATDMIALKITTVGSPVCLGANRTIAIAEGDTPVTGIDSVALGSSTDCM